ncbi:hypothetical protein BC831DRAFT_444700 [Entophlyctis helioformis]|nr:hypothetical protein BC831DRAFT_444700 [Entophlyctis helioformis]
MSSRDKGRVSLDPSTSPTSPTSPVSQASPALQMQPPTAAALPPKTASKPAAQKGFSRLLWSCVPSGGPTGSAAQTKPAQPAAANPQQTPAASAKTAAMSNHRHDLLKLLSDQLQSIEAMETDDFADWSDAVAVVDDLVDKCYDLRSKIMHEHDSTASVKSSSETISGNPSQSQEWAVGQSALAAHDIILENREELLVICNAVAAKINRVPSPGLTDSQTDLLSDIVKLSETARSLVLKIQEGESAKSNEPQSPLVSFISDGNLDVAIHVVKLAKAAAEFAPIPGISAALGMIESILSNAKNNLRGVAGMQSFCNDLVEFRNALAPVSRMPFSPDARRRCDDLLELLKEAQAAIEAAKERNKGISVYTGASVKKITSQISGFQSRLAKLKELLGYSMQIDSILMLMYQAKQLNLINDKVDDIYRILRPRGLHVQRDDYQIAEQTLDIRGRFSVRLARMDGQMYVLKEFNSILDDKTKEAIEAEAHKWFKFSHSNLLPLSGICLDDKDGARPFVTTPFLEHDLESYLAANPDITTLDRLRVLTRVARGVKYLHKFAPGAPVVHGSLTMRHIRMDAKAKRVKISVGMLAHRALGGSDVQWFKYAAPEVKEDGYEFKPPMDVYAFGIIAMAVLAGEPVERVRAEVTPKPAGVVDTVWSVLKQACLVHDYRRPKFDAIVKCLTAATKADQENRPVLPEGASDLQTLCFLFPEWAQDSEISETSEQPTGEMLSVYDPETRRNVPNLRLEWDAQYNLTALRLTGCGLSGNIPKEIGRLTQLKELWLDQNSLDGEIPTEICRLTRLVTLRLGQNKLTGPVPYLICKLKALEELDIAGCKLNAIPPTLAQLSKLRELYISRNLITVLPDLSKLQNLEIFQAIGTIKCKLAHIPPETGQLLALEELDLSEHGLKSVPDELFQLRNLQTLSLFNNNLDCVPDAIANLHVLESLDLSVNELNTLSPSIGLLGQLSVLDLSNNNLAILPDAFGNMTGLVDLDLSNNQLASLPSTFGMLKAMDKLNLSNNNLATLPVSFGQLSRLTDLILSQNEMVSLPAEFGQLKNLRWLNLDTNHIVTLDGAGFGQLVKMEKLDLSSNQLSDLPAEMASLTRLTELALSSNKFDLLPTCVSSMTNLQILLASHNQITSFPPSIQSLTKLTKIAAFNNSITSLPTEIGKLKTLSVLILRNNKLELLPDGLCDCTRLRRLSLRQNHLSTLPDRFGQLAAIHDLDLSSNLFVSIPLQIYDLVNLIELDLSGNQITLVSPLVSNLQKLEALYLSNNQITSIPVELNKCKSLGCLILSHNKLQHVPKELAQLSSLVSLDLAYNNLEETGTLPRVVAKLTKLADLDLSGNKKVDVKPSE